MKADRRAKVITADKNFLREHTVAELLAGSPEGIEILVDADYNRLTGGAVRRATQVSDLLDGGPR